MRREDRSACAEGVEGGGGGVPLPHQPGGVDMWWTVASCYRCARNNEFYNVLGHVL